MQESSKRPRLMFVLGLAPQKIGGIEKFLRRLVLAMDERGWDTVLCFDGPISGEFREYVGFPCVTVESLDGQGDLGLQCAGELRRLLRKHKPKIFVYAFHGVMRCFPWMAKLAGCRRIFFNDHSSRPPGHKAQPLSLLKRIAGRFLTAPLTAICSVSEFTRRTGDALGLTSAPNFVVLNGVEIHTKTLEKRLAVRKQYGISNEALVITQVCWMVDVKGVEGALHAAAMLLSDYPEVRFLFVGEGSRLEAYKELATKLRIEASVVFTGLINNPTGVGIFDATDIYCQPSVWQEASGLAVLEAMSLKVPVVASDTGGLAELIKHGRSGLLVPVNNSGEIYSALKRLVEDPELRQRMGEEGFRLVENNHRLEDTVQKYADLFLQNETSRSS